MVVERLNTTAVSRSAGVPEVSNIAAGPVYTAVSLSAGVTPDSITATDVIAPAGSRSAGVEVSETDANEFH